MSKDKYDDVAELLKKLTVQVQMLNERQTMLDTFYKQLNDAFHDLYMNQKMMYREFKVLNPGLPDE